ncbi:MAG TPA: 4-(cytidine 5'-diphospho)-2-C-methyl-D-erythritol kinase [Xanthobacteraceae bacterium]|nr:4-(cytidine 5'-diphospho)-2-C-methyl-D-erythritol kinase [Xanthobacteraceae bacterium]
MNAPLSTLAPAKVNLTLRIRGRRADGLHDLESLVAFAAIGDRLSLEPGPVLGLDIEGPLRNGCGPLAENLVLKAVSALQARVVSLRIGRFVLSKHLPVAAGLGGGSADAAAALRLLAEANALSAGDPRLLEAARHTGADVPVCIDSLPRLMRGAGEILSPPQKLPRLAALLVNPAAALSTKEVFEAFDALPQRPASGRCNDDGAAIPEQREALLAWLHERPNDLEAAAIARQPVIGNVLRAMRALPGCRLARMSGSGATCFALWQSTRTAAAAARSLRAAQPKWWIRTTVLGG